MGIIGSSGDEGGRPVIDRSTCNLCGECAEICPGGVLVRGDRQIFIDHSSPFDCIGCSHCMMVCPMGSIAVTGRKVTPGDVVDLPPRDRRATFGQIEALMLARRSIRRFREEAVPREMIDKVVAAAATAPMGIPPWEVGVTVYYGWDKVRELANDTADAYERFLKFFGGPAGFFFKRLMKKPARQQFESFILPLGRILVEGRKKGVDNVLYNAPAAILFHASPYGDVADAVIACTYAMLAAEAMGLGTCMIGCLPPVLARRKDLMRKHGVPEGNVPKLVLILGYPAIEYRRAIRRPLHSVIEG